MYVYFIKTEALPPMVKIGKARSPEDRMATLQTGCPYELILLGTVSCRSDMHADAAEKRLHRHFQAERTRGEWFRYTDKVARIIAAVVGKPVAAMNDEIFSCREVSKQKNGSLTRQQRWREYERQRSAEALAGLRELDAQFRASIDA
jgi:hypothetical protein